MNKFEFQVEGMTCQGCVRSVQSKLTHIKPQLDQVKVQLEYPQLSFTSSEQPDLIKLQKVLGHYTISVNPPQTVKIQPIVEVKPAFNIATYKPLFLIVSFIIGVNLLAQYPFTEFSWMTWMRHFMAGFFIVFSFFKLLNISGFAQSFAMYDVLAKKWSSWGQIYPFVELSLGIMYLINFNPIITNSASLLVMCLGTIGVIQSNLKKEQIKCACLGDVFNLPMSSVTIIENVTMIIMAIAMLLLFI